MVIALDIGNAFNEIKCQYVLKAIWNDEEIRPLWYYSKTIVGFIGLGYGPSMVKALFQCKGEKQGDMESMPTFCLGIHEVNKLTLMSLKDKGGWLVAGADDTYILGPLSVVFAEVREHKVGLETIGLALHYGKCTLQICTEMRNITF